MTEAIARQDERRRSPRSEVPASAVVLAGGRCGGRYRVENLSAGGALLVGDGRVRPGERVTMFLELPGLKPIRLGAEVLRRQGEAGDARVAVAFRQLAPGVEDTIQRVVLASLERLHEASVPHVLVVDDAPQVCRALERDLHALGRRAVSAATPREAVTSLCGGERHIDAAVVDLRLGDADGLELLAFFSDRRPDVRRILMSGNLRPCQLELAVTSGRAHAVIDKPWTRADLARVLGTAQRGAAPTPSGPARLS